MPSHTSVLQAMDGRTEQLGRCLHGLRESVRGMPGCLGVEVRRLPHDAALWVLESRWQSAAQMQAFFAAPLLQQVLDRAMRQGLLRSLHCAAA